MQKSVNLLLKDILKLLPEIDIKTTHVSELNEISCKKEVNGKIYSAFNILNSETLDVLKTISNGKYLINGFTNKMIRKEIFNDSESRYIIGKTTRLLSKLKAHGLIKKVAKKNKYYLTTKGRKITNTILLFTQKELLS